jgi:hypothetical protein
MAAIYRQMLGDHALAAWIGLAALMAQLLIASWVGRETAPRWHYGLNVMAGKTIGASLTVLLLWGTSHTGAAAETLKASVVMGTSLGGWALRLLASTALICGAACLGAYRQEAGRPACDKVVC